MAVFSLPELPCDFLKCSACETSGLILASHLPAAVYIRMEVKKRSTELRPRFIVSKLFLSVSK